MADTGEKHKMWWVRGLTTNQRDAILVAIDAKAGLRPDWYGRESTYERARPLTGTTRDTALEAIRWALEHDRDLLPEGRRTMRQVEDWLVCDYAYQYSEEAGVEMNELSERQLARLLLNAADFFRSIARIEAKEQNSDTERVAQEISGLQEYIRLRRSEGVEA